MTRTTRQRTRERWKDKEKKRLARLTCVQMNIPINRAGKVKGFAYHGRKERERREGRERERDDNRKKHRKRKVENKEKERRKKRHI